MMYWRSGALVACLTSALACGSEGDGLGPQRPISPPIQRDTFSISGRITGRVTGTGSTARNAAIFLYGYFEGDTVARSLARTSAGDSDVYVANIADRLIVSSDSTFTGVARRRWRALAIVFPLIRPGSGVTLALGDWVTRSAGDTTPAALPLDIGLLQRGEMTAKLPVTIPSGLPARSAAPDLSAVTDSVRRFGAELFVRITATTPRPLMDFIDTPAALISLADAGLKFPSGHGAFVVLENSLAGETGGYTVWGRIAAIPASDARDVVDRLAALPFVTAIEPLNVRQGDMRFSNHPTLDSAPLSGADERRFIYRRPGSCYTDSPSEDAAGAVACGEFILGLKAGSQSADLGAALSALGARILRESAPALVPDGQRSILIEVPNGTERRAFGSLQQSPLLRYVALNQIGRLL